ncbi:hypothetical protein [Dongia sp.]|uniref:hypothetical protein n=1 Tax=Dongia sp. TaxID=1977262 RepID=UPI0035B3D967
MCNAYVSTAIQVAGTALQATQSIRNANYQAAQIKEDAKAEEAAAVLREDDRSRRMKALLADNLSRYSASGVDNSVGTPSDVSADTASAFARESFMDNYNTDRSVRTSKLQAKNTKRSGTNMAVSSLFDLGSSVAQQEWED